MTSHDVSIIIYSSAFMLWAYVVLVLHSVLISIFNTFASAHKETISTTNSKLQYGFATIIFWANTKFP